MQVNRFEIDGILEFVPKVFGDERGYFFESFRKDVFEKEVGIINFVQENESFSKKGVLRGLHFQREPYAQSKLVRVISGEVFDVAVDLRKNSKTFGQYVSVILSDKTKNQFWIPKGFAHGFMVLSETAIFSYKCDNYYAPSYDAGLLWNDSAVNINWPIHEISPILSEKDKLQPKLLELSRNI